MPLFSSFAMPLLPLPRNSKFGDNAQNAFSEIGNIAAKRCFDIIINYFKAFWVRKLRTFGNKSMMIRCDAFAAAHFAELPAFGKGIGNGKPMPDGLAAGIY